MELEKLKKALNAGSGNDADEYKALFKRKELTKREHFAGLAMQGLCASGANDFNFDHVDRIAQIAVFQADALIEALNKPVDGSKEEGE